MPIDYFPGEMGIMRSGVFNLGFIALRKSESSLRFLKWWSMHLRDECIVEMESGYFVDQKWVDLLPACFEDVCIMRNAAYNIAYWNLHERSLYEREGVLREAHSDISVAFIHFSGIDINDLNSIAKYAARNPFSAELHRKRYTLKDRPDLAPTFLKYKELLLREGIEAWSQLPYGYGTFSNGEKISQLERSLYRISPVWQGGNLDPFAVGSGSFWEACRKSGIKPCRTVSTSFTGAELTERYRLARRMVRLLLSFLVRVLGSEKYLQFAKYMRYQLLPSHHGFLLRRASTQSLSPAPSKIRPPAPQDGKNRSTPMVRSVNE
jgi:hypothetical protein